ncbi:hypothetical protein XENOCAPTIV_012338 [Xenoophorus captivus]|uniref:Uncharacterized protein n=1 Tax=Xenoophorus captivus TaxID=1517983 RepID=A0ABV0RZI9_9TELE
MMSWKRFYKVKILRLAYWTPVLKRKACVCLLGQEEVQPSEAIIFPPAPSPGRQPACGNTQLLTTEGFLETEAQREQADQSGLFQCNGMVKRC